MTLLIVYFCLWSFGINAIWFCKASIQNNLSGAIPKRLNWLLLEVGGQGHKSVLFYFLHFPVILFSVRGVVLEPFQMPPGKKGGFTPDRSPVHYRVNTDANRHVHSLPGPHWSHLSTWSYMALREIQGTRRISTQGLCKFQVERTECELVRQN